MRDVSRKIWIGLPLGSLLFCVAVAVISPDLYKAYIRRHEVGALEHGTVICLVPAVAFGVMAWAGRRKLPTPWLAGWSLLITLGALYFGGEECSWGQNYIHWATPEGWSRLNDQHETNLHNTSGLFDQLPRDLLSAAAIFCVVTSVAIRSRRQQWNPATNAWSWLLPTPAVFVAALIAVLSGLPQKFYHEYHTVSAAIPAWFDQMFLRGHHSEFKEYFLAMFILMYQWSWVSRLRSMKASEQQLADRGPAERNETESAATPARNQAA